MSCVAQEAIFDAVDQGNKKYVQSWIVGNDVNMCDEQGQSLLIHAVRHGHVKMVKILLKRGAEVNIVDKVGKTTLDYAVEVEHDKMVVMLVKKKAAVTTQEYADKVRQLVRKRGRRFVLWYFGSIMLAACAGFMLMPLVMLLLPPLLTPTLPIFACAAGLSSYMGFFGTLFLLYPGIYQFGLSNNCVLLPQDSSKTFKAVV